MGKTFDAIPPELAEWLGQQHVFFVATAPLAGDGLVNCSPKGMDSFRVLGPKVVSYLDLTGSGIETVAHLRQNGRIVFMFCAFEGSPKIVRLHGTGRAVTPEAAEYQELRAHFPEHAGERSVIVADLVRISDSCGYAVPFFDYRGERESLARWAQSKGVEGLADYRRGNNALSLDRLPGIDLSEGVG